MAAVTASGSPLLKAGVFVARCTLAHPVIATVAQLAAAISRCGRRKDETSTKTDFAVFWQRPSSADGPLEAEGPCVLVVGSAGPDELREEISPPESERARRVGRAVRI